MATTRFAAVTIASKSYLALARVTARSFRDHNPDMEFLLLLADEENGQIDRANEPFSSIIALDDLGIPEPDRFRFQCSELELCYALTPYAIDFLLGRGFDGVIFLKQETLVLDELGSVAADLERHSALLTPHFLEPPRRPDALTWERNVLLAGVFNCGFVAFSACQEARTFLAWWKERTFRECTRDVANGLHFEQRWLDFAPSLMPRHRVLRDPGMNVGHWNLWDREIRLQNGSVTARGRPCRVFRFSGYDPERPEVVTRHGAPRAVESTGDAARVFSLYREMLAQAGYRETRRLPYAYGRFDNGVAVTDQARRTYRRLGSRARRFGNPFEAEPAGSYYRWLGARRAWRQG